jgi:hypothetical protein
MGPSYKSEIGDVIERLTTKNAKNTKGMRNNAFLFI